MNIIVKQEWKTFFYSTASPGIAYHEYEGIVPSNMVNSLADTDLWDAAVFSRL